MGERVNGIHEVRGSIPLASIKAGRLDGETPRRLVRGGPGRLHCALDGVVAPLGVWASARLAV